jgi:hypothetical protein
MFDWTISNQQMNFKCFNLIKLGLLVEISFLNYLVTTHIVYLNSKKNPQIQKSETAHTNLTDAVTNL